MRFITRRGRLAEVLAAALCAALLAGCASSAPREAPPAATPAETSGDASRPLPEEEELRAAVERALEGTGVPGAAVAVTAADGSRSIALIGEAGPGTAVSAGTRFAYRSITKSFIGTVILQLAEEGLIDLDAPIAEYVDGVPHGETITIAELATMRSGLANYSALPGMGEMLDERGFGHDPAVADLLALAFAEPLDFEPGEAYEYSNTGTVLLGEAIEAATGRSWQEAVAERITRPLGLDSVHVGAGDAATDALGFQLEGGEAVEELPELAPGWFGAAGALNGDIVDLAAWGRAFGAGSLLDPATRQQRLESLGPTDDDPASPEYDRYGFAMGEIAGWIGHTGNGLGFQSLVMYDPASERVVAILLGGTGENANLPAAVFRDLLLIPELR